MLFTAVAAGPAAAVVCSVNIRPMEAQRVALAAGQNGTINPFVVYVEDDQAVAARFCWLTMLDSQVRLGHICHALTCIAAVEIAV
jgi:hypothetical protein